jgi:hypothetical protein
MDKKNLVTDFSRGKEEDDKYDPMPSSMNNEFSAENTKGSSVHGSKKSRKKYDYWTESL